MKTLIAFFSAEGNTKALAEKLASVVEGDVFEIVPEKPYTKEEINWKNPLSRCNKEKMGKKDVPIANKVEGFDGYDMVYLGFPIWYFGAPNIINTFVKGYDWTGKKLALFATSGGSEMGKTLEKLQPYISGNPEVVDARRFSVSVSEDELKSWVESLIEQA